MTKSEFSTRVAVGVGVLLGFVLLPKQYAFSLLGLILIASNYYVEKAAIRLMFRKGWWLIAALVLFFCEYAWLEVLIQSMFPTVEFGYFRPVIIFCLIFSCYHIGVGGASFVRNMLPGSFTYEFAFTRLMLGLVFGGLILSVIGVMHRKRDPLPVEPLAKYEIIIDTATSCQYLETRFGLSPRLGSDGKQMGCKGGINVEPQ